MVFMLPFIKMKGIKSWLFKTNLEYPAESAEVREPLSDAAIMPDYVVGGDQPRRRERRRPQDRSRSRVEGAWSITIVTE